jgi:ATP adenylyltransferase
MDHIWTPWRYQYMKEVTSDKQPACIFCDAAARQDDAETLVVYRGPKTFIILNRYPYTVEAALRANYKPDGMNLGMNLGRAAGAGVLGHLHLHMLPRWFGDSNFMAVTGETRVHPEELKTTYERLRKALS